LSSLVSVVISYCFVLYVCHVNKVLTCLVWHTCDTCQLVTGCRSIYLLSNEVRTVDIDNND